MAKVVKYEAELIICVIVTPICSAATVSECFLSLQLIEYLRQQMYSALVVKSNALFALFKEDTR